MNDLSNIDPKACRDLLFAIIKEAVKERDIKFLKSSRCTNILNNVVKEDVDVDNLQRKIVKKAMTL